MEESKENKKPISKQEKIKLLETQLAELKKKAKEESKRIAYQEKAAAKKTETRKKIVLGAYILDQMKDDVFRSSYLSKLDRYLKRNSERRLFDLPDLPEPSEQLKETDEDGALRACNDRR